MPSQALSRHLLRPLFLALLLILLQSASGITVKRTDTKMSASFARTLPWQVRVSGQCGKDCKTVRRMQSASCTPAAGGGDRLFVAWTAHAGWVKNAQYPEQNLYDETSVGHIAEYSIGVGTHSATLVSDTELAWCNEMGDVAVAADCSVVGVLCRSSKEAAEVGAVDFVASAQKAHGDQFGWSQTSQPDPKQKKCKFARRRDGE